MHVVLIVDVEGLSDEVVFEKVVDDARFNTYGVPRNKTKSTKKASDKKETVPNAN